MSKKILFAFAASLVLLGFKFDDVPPQTPEEILRQVAEKYQKYQSISYEIEFDMKFFSGADTNHIVADCHLYRQPEDSIFGGYLWFDSEDGYDRIYDLDKLYLRDPNEKVITQYEAHQGEVFIIEGNIIGDIKDTYFLHPDRLIRNAESETLTRKLRKESLNGQKYWRIDLLPPDDEQYSDMVKTIWVNRKTLLIERMVSTIKFQGEYQYKEWKLRNIRFDEISEADFTKRVEALKAEFPLEIYQRPDESYYATLENGVASPDFQGIHYQEQDSLSLADYREKIVILDFWYMDCFPCIKAIPHLNEVYGMYKDQGVMVLGVNSKDLSERDQNRMVDFLKHNPLDYPIVLTSYKTDSVYNVKAYPTLYAIDKEGKIIYSQIGYNEALKDTLDRVIRKELKLD
jgi:thiol-disulfide isomerase/thioredoxin